MKVMKKQIAITALLFLLTAFVFVTQGFCLDERGSQNPFEISCPVFNDESVLVKNQKIVCTEDFASIDYVISGKKKKNISAVIDCKVLGFQRLCNDILIPLDFCIKSDGKEIPFEVFLNGTLADKSVYYKSLNEENGEIYKTTDKIEIRFDFEIDGEKTLNVSYKNLSYHGMFCFLYDIPLARNTGGVPVDYTFVYKGIENSEIYPSEIGISLYDKANKYFSKAEDTKLDFARFTEGEFFWKADLKQHSFSENAKFDITFVPFNIFYETSVLFIPYWEKNGRIVTHNTEGNLIDFSNEKISEDLLFFMTKSQLAIFRNAFYAIHGYKFKNKKYKKYFTLEEWYKVNPDFNESNLNEIERANVNLIKKYEEKQK